MDKKFNWMENEYMHFYNSDFNANLDYSNSQNNSELDDYVYELNVVPETKRMSAPTSCRTEQNPTSQTPLTKPDPSCRPQPNLIEVGAGIAKSHEQARSKSNSKIVNLNKFIKHKTLGYLKVLEQAKLLTNQESESLRAYEQDNCSAVATSRLFGIQSVRKKCRDFYFGPQLGRSILISEASFNRKIQLLRSMGRAGNTIQKSRQKSTKKGQSN